MIKAVAVFFFIPTRLLSSPVITGRESTCNKRESTCNKKHNKKRGVIL